MTDLTDTDFIKQLNEHLAAGGVIAFPTDTVWGLGALPTPAGAAALYEIKRRPREKRLIIMSDSMAHIRPHMTKFPKAAFELAEKYWPGALTLGREISDGDTALFGGVRVPRYAPFQALCAVVHGHCLATTSANISGMPPLDNAADIQATFPNIIVIDNATEPMGGAPSTVAIVTENNGIKIARAGAIVIPGAK